VKPRNITGEAKPHSGENLVENWH